MPYFINTGMFEGVSTNIFFPLLDQDYVINRIVYGIRQNENDIFIPWFQSVIVYLSYLLFPAKARGFLFKYLCGHDIMDQFVGRGNSNAIFKTGETK